MNLNLFSWQKNLLEIWLDSFSVGNRQMLKSNLACQEIAMNMGVKFQLLYWDSYLQLMKQIFIANKPIEQQDFHHSKNPDLVRSLIGGSLHSANTELSQIQVILEPNSNSTNH